MPFIGLIQNYLIDGGRGQYKEEKTGTKPYHNLTATLKAKGCIKPPPPKCSKPQKETLWKDRTYSQIKLDSIVVTHPDEDHFGGIDALLGSGTKDIKKKHPEQYTVCSPIISTSVVPLLVNPPKIRAETRQGDDYQRSTENDCLKFWFQGDSPGKKHTYLESLSAFTTVEISTAEKKKMTKLECNKTSILTTVKLPSSKFHYDVVLTGDSYCTIIEEKLALRDKLVGVFQVPHHGSKYNLNVKKSAATVGELAAFYSSFKADIYLISHGDHGSYNHPHSEVITGIITAAIENNHHCKIIVTATKFEESQISEVINWTEYVEIYHFIPDTPYVTLDPSNDTKVEGLQRYIKKVHMHISV